MYLYVELWNVTQEWMNLSKEDRRSFFDSAEERIRGLKDAGVENLGWAMNDEHTPYRSDYRYMAVWRVPNLEMVEELEKTMKKAGWHKYFLSANSRGKIIPFSDSVEQLINLEKRSTSLLD